MTARTERHLPEAPVRAAGEGRPGRPEEETP
jgi:hypothetical protein